MVVVVNWYPLCRVGLVVGAYPTSWSSSRDSVLCLRSRAVLTAMVAHIAVMECSGAAAVTYTVRAGSGSVMSATPWAGIGATVA